MHPYLRSLQALTLLHSAPEERQTGQVKLQVKRSWKVFTYKYVALAGWFWYLSNFFPLFPFAIKNFKLIICDLHWPGWLFWNKKEDKASHREISLMPFTSPLRHYLCPNFNKIRLGLQDQSASIRPKLCMSAWSLFQMVRIIEKYIETCSSKSSFFTFIYYFTW